MYFNLKHKEPLIVLNRKLWDYFPSDDLKTFLSTLDTKSFQIHRLTQEIILEIKNEDDVIMFKLLFGEYL